jgi:cell division protein FtsB
MDDPIVLFILLLVLALILTATVLPIVALVISIRTRSKLTKQLAALGLPPLAPTDNRNVQAALAQLQARVVELEAFVAQERPQQRPIERPPIAPIEQPPDERPESTATIRTADSSTDFPHHRSNQRHSRSQHSESIRFNWSR